MRSSRQRGRSAAGSRWPFIGISKGATPSGTALAEAVLDRFGIGAVATARPLYHRSSRKSLADVVHCIRHKTTLDEAGRGLAPNAEARLRSPADIERLFRDRPHWVEASLEIAERCRFSLTELRYMFPSDELCQPGESPDQALRRLTEAGLVMRYGGTQRVPASVRAQIEKELTLIATIDKASYFLSVQEVVEMARSRRILCQGRGSAANSAVCYALGITAVDPGSLQPALREVPVGRAERATRYRRRLRARTP